jgi:hypothetical protein
MVTAIIRKQKTMYAYTHEVLIYIDKAPRAKSKKVRKYSHIDLTKEFEIKTKRRETEKREKLEELYTKLDQKALEMRDVVSIHK